LDEQFNHIYDDDNKSAPRDNCRAISEQFTRDEIESSFDLRAGDLTSLLSQFGDGEGENKTDGILVNAQKLDCDY
jgi:hypothetical protein